MQLSQAGTGLNVSRPDYIGGQAILEDYRKRLSTSTGGIRAGTHRSRLAHLGPARKRRQQRDPRAGLLERERRIEQGVLDDRAVPAPAGDGRI